MVLWAESYARRNYGNVNVSKVVGGYWTWLVRYQLVSDHLTVSIHWCLTIESRRNTLIVLNLIISKCIQRITMYPHGYVYVIVYAMVICKCMFVPKYPVNSADCPVTPLVLEHKSVMVSVNSAVTCNTKHSNVMLFWSQNTTVVHGLMHLHNTIM